MAAVELVRLDAERVSRDVPRPVRPDRRITPREDVRRANRGQRDVRERLLCRCRGLGPKPWKRRLANAPVGSAEERSGGNIRTRPVRAPQLVALDPSEVWLEDRVEELAGRPSGGRHERAQVHVGAGVQEREEDAGERVADHDRAVRRTDRLHPVRDTGVRVVDGKVARDGGVTSPLELVDERSPEPGSEPGPVDQAERSDE